MTIPEIMRQLQTCEEKLLFLHREMLSKTDDEIEHFLVELSVEEFRQLLKQGCSKHATILSNLDQVCMTI